MPSRKMVERDREKKAREKKISKFEKKLNGWWFTSYSRPEEMILELENKLNIEIIKLYEDLKVTPKKPLTEPEEERVNNIIRDCLEELYLKLDLKGFTDSKITDIWFGEDEALKNCKETKKNKIFDNCDVSAKHFMNEAYMNLNNDNFTSDVKNIDIFNSAELNPLALFSSSSEEEILTDLNKGKKPRNKGKK